MSQRRFAIVAQRFPLEPPTPPGEDYFAEPAHMMAEAGVAVEILTIRHSGQTDTENFGPVLVRRFASSSALIRWLATAHYDLLHAHSHFRPALIAGWLARRSKTVFTSHSYALPASFWKRRVLLTLMNRFDRVTALTAYEHEIYRAAGIADSKIITLPLMVNLGFFTRGGDAQQFRQRWNISPSEPVILFVANLRPVKNPDVVIQAFQHVRRQLPSARLVIVGQNLMGAEPPHGDGIIFTDWLDAVALRDALAATTVAVNSSAHESFGLALLEAAAASCPLCLPKLGSLQSLFGNNALYHEPRDAAGLASNILRYLREPELRTAHLAANRQRVAQFDTPMGLQRFRTLYFSLLEG